MIELNAASIAGGGLMERLDQEIQKAVANCLDVNTPPKKVRTVTLKIKIKPDNTRCYAGVSVETSSALCAAEPISTAIYMGADPRTGEVKASEVFAGENPDQNILPEVGKHISGKITVFPQANKEEATC